MEQSQIEAGINFMAPPFLNYDVNRVVNGRVGNRERNVAH